MFEIKCDDPSCLAINKICRHSVEEWHKIEAVIEAARVHKENASEANYFRLCEAVVELDKSDAATRVE